MRGEGDRTNGVSMRTDAEHAGTGSCCTRRYFVKGIGAAGAVGGIGNVPNVAAASRNGSGVNSANRLSQLWSTALSDTVQDYLIDDGLLYVGTQAGFVRALDVKTGREVNRIDLGEAIPPYGIAKDGKQMAVGLANGRLKLLDIDSFSARQTIPFSGQFMGVAGKNGSAYLATKEGIERISLSNGKTHWRFDRGANSPIWATSEGLAVHMSDSAIIVLDEDNGETIWKQGVRSGSAHNSEKTGNWLQDDKFWGLTELESYFVTSSVDGGYEFLDKFTGEKLWKAGGGGGVDRAVANSNQVIHQYDTSIISRKIDTGEEQWKTDFVTPHAKSMILYDGSLVVFGTRESDDTDVMMSLNPSTRAIEWETEVDGPIGLVSKNNSRMFGVNLARDEIRAYVPGGAQTAAARATPTSRKTPGPGGDGGNDERKSTDRASFLLTSKQTSVPVGETVTLTLSAVNYVTSDQMTVQLLLETPSGVEVVAVEGADAGSNQFTAVTTVDKGGEANLNIKLRLNEPGTHTIGGQTVFYFGEDTDNGNSTKHSVTVSAKEKDSDDGSGTAMLRGGNDVLQWVGANPIVSLLVVAVGGLVGAGLVRRRRGADESVAGTDGEQTHGKRNTFRAVTRTAHRAPNVMDGLGGLQTIVDTAIVKPLSWSYRKADWGGFALGTLGVFFAGQLVLAIMLGLLLQPLLLALNGFPAGDLVGTGVEFVVTLGIWGMLLYGIVRAISMVNDLEPQATGSGSRGRQRTPTAQGASDNPEHELAGEWKHETVEAEQAHRDAQQRDQQPVDVGEKVAFPIREVTHEEGQVRGEVETFQIFVDQDVPSDLQVGDTICVQIMSYATNEDGNRIGAHARFLNHGAC